MAAHGGRPEHDALSALPFRSSLKEGQFSTAKIKFESGRIVDEVLPNVYSSRKESYAFNPFGPDENRPARLGLETFMEEEGVGDLLRHPPIHYEASFTTKIKHEDGRSHDDAVMDAPPSDRKESECPGPMQFDIRDNLTRQISRSDNALPILKVDTYPTYSPNTKLFSKFESHKSDSDAVLPGPDSSSRKDAPNLQLPSYHSYIHIAAKQAVDASRSDEESRSPTSPSKVSSWKGPDSCTSSSSKIKFESRRQETRNTPSGYYSEYYNESRRDSMDGSKDSASKAGPSENPQGRRRPHAIESTKNCSMERDRHSSPGVMVDIPWLRTDDIASLDGMVALGSVASNKEWIDETGRPSPEFSPAGSGSKSRKVQILAAPAPYEDFHPSSVASDGSLHDAASTEQKRHWMHGNRAKSDRQLLTKNRETMVGRGQSFPTLAAGVISAEPSGEWWSPSALRLRLDSRAVRQTSRTAHQSTEGAAGNDSPGDDMRHAASATAMRASAFQSPVVQRDLDPELQQYSHDSHAAAKTSRHSAAHAQLAASAAPPAWQTARPAARSLEALSAEPILEESDYFNHDDRQSSQERYQPLRKDCVVKLAALRSRRHPRISMPTMPGEDAPDPSQAHPHRGADFKSYNRGDLALSRIAAPYDATAVLSPGSQMRLPNLLQPQYRNL